MRHIEPKGRFTTTVFNPKNFLTFFCDERDRLAVSLRDLIASLEVDQVYGKDLNLRDVYIDDLGTSGVCLLIEKNGAAVGLARLYWVASEQHFWLHGIVVDQFADPDEVWSKLLANAQYLVEGTTRSEESPNRLVVEVSRHMQMILGEELLKRWGYTGSPNGKRWSRDVQPNEDRVIYPDAFRSKQAAAL